MQNVTTALKNRFIRQLPIILGKPLLLMPFPVQKRIVTLVFHRVFKDALKDGEMDFLQDLYIRFEIEDCKLKWTYTFNGQSLQMVNNNRADATIRCHLRDFILLANRRVDPDTLFFQRRLFIEGNTELGLTMKNLMDSINPQSLPLPLLKGLQLIEYLLVQ